jgi:hypothetical protein
MGRRRWRPASSPATGKGPTHGLLFDAVGSPLTGIPLTQSEGYLRSGGAVGARDGLRQDWYPLAQVTREHVEAHAAALLRKPGAPREAVLVVNKPTCVSKGEYVGCDEVLPGMLHDGSRLGPASKSVSAMFSPS